MKKLNLFLTLVLTITLFSCSSDDDAGNIEITEANLIGKWQWRSSTENGEADELDECDLMDTIEFKANDIVTYISHEEENDSCMEFTDDSPWSLDGNVISYESGDSDETVSGLTNTTLKLTYFEEEDGETDTYVDTYTKI